VLFIAQDYEKYFDGCEGYDEEEEAPLPPINEEASACGTYSILQWTKILTL
jgi:hypothetical protein